jgi:hypothetical protein
MCSREELQRIFWARIFGQGVKIKVVEHIQQQVGGILMDVSIKYHTIQLFTGTILQRRVTPH